LKGIFMEQQYWLGRTREASRMARSAATAETRLIHLDLAGRYSVQAATCGVGVAAPSIEPPVADRPILRLFQ
jgi:hypothetical protein